MWIEREIIQELLRPTEAYIQILIGPRQCGKSSLLWYIGKDRYKEITFDDLQMRNLAETDPAFFLSQQKPPLIIDEVQYAPNIFPELKKIVDTIKKETISGKPPHARPLFRLTGSNQILMDKNIKETLAGRAEYYYLNTLTVSEILKAFPSLNPHEILIKGGWPEIYTGAGLNTIRYLNDYIRNFIEKDIVLSSGISKQKEFNTVLGMLAARSGEYLNCSAIANASGVKSVTVKEWVSILERTGLVYLLQPVEKNLNKRLIRTPKIYFLDTGLAARLQGWTELQPLMLSSQAGHLFESLVLSEIVKFSANSGKYLKISVWRTKEGEEVDFVVEGSDGRAAAFDSKMGIHSVQPESLPPSFAKNFPEIKELVIVSIGGERKYISPGCLQVPISRLTEYLKELF
jgi:predicted AAA+ superfamily ATPase